MLRVQRGRCECKKGLVCRAVEVEKGCCEWGKDVVCRQVEKLKRNKDVAGGKIEVEIFVEVADFDTEANLVVALY